MEAQQKIKIIVPILLRRLITDEHSFLKMRFHIFDSTNGVQHWMFEACLIKILGHKKREARKTREETMLKSHGQIFNDTVAIVFE